jgi:hypothetical protein
MTMVRWTKLGLRKQKIVLSSNQSCKRIIQMAFEMTGLVGPSIGEYYQEWEKPKGFHKIPGRTSSGHKESFEILKLEPSEVRK